MKIIWDISSKCNLKCIHCGANDNLQRTSSKTEKKEYLNIANNISKIANEVVLLGGEPLLLECINDVLKVFIQNQVDVSFITNGQCNSECFKGISTINTAFISFDGLENTNDKIRGKGTWRKAIHFLDDIRKCETKFNTIGVTLVLNKLNYKEVLDYIDFFDNMQIDEISINLLDISGSAKSNMLELELAKDVIITTLLKIAAHKTNHARLLIDTGSASLNKLIILRTGFTNLVYPSRCDALFGSAYCDMDGFMKPCRKYANLGLNLKVENASPFDYNPFLLFLEKLCTGSAADKICPLEHHTDVFNSIITEDLLNEYNLPQFTIKNNIIPLQIKNRFFLFIPKHNSYIEISSVAYKIYQLHLNKKGTKDVIDNIECSFEDYLSFIENEIKAERIEVITYENN